MEFDTICCFAAMTYESCDSNSKSANVLKSPEFTLSSAQQLELTMALVPFVDYSTVEVYKTSSLGIIGTRLGSITVDPPIVGSEFPIQYITFRICLPAGTYQLAFIASDAPSATRSTAIITEVFLSISNCTVPSNTGISKQCLC